MPADLKPKEPIELTIDYKMMVIGIFIFALVFWAMGAVFRHYITLRSVGI